MIIIQKRNGKNVLFNKHKITNAINKAFLEVDGTLYETDTANDIANDIELELIKKNKKNISVEEIQDMIEEYLMRAERKDVARAYIRYRYLHGLARNDYKELMDVISEKVSAANLQNQNANVDEASFGGRIGEASDSVMKKFALDYCVSPMARSNHLNNEIYIHDLSSYPVGSHNCLSIPFDDLLAKGFNTRQTSVRPAKSVNTAFQLVAVIFQLQSLQQFGGVSATHLDWTMVPYVRKSFFKHYKDGCKYLDGKEEIDYSFYSDLPIDESDYKAYSKKAYKYAIDMTTREIEQAVEGMFHNLNTLQSRSGNQLN